MLHGCMALPGSRTGLSDNTVHASETMLADSWAGEASRSRFRLAAQAGRLSDIHLQTSTPDMLRLHACRRLARHRLFRTWQPAQRTGCRSRQCEIAVFIFAFPQFHT